MKKKMAISFQKTMSILSLIKREPKSNIITVDFLKRQLARKDSFKNTKNIFPWSLSFYIHIFFSFKMIIASWNNGHLL